MDNTLLTDRHQSNVNGSNRRASSASISSPMSPGRPTLLLDGGGGGGNNQIVSSHVVKVVVNRDDRGYGMKVSGDNPVYVQSVKEGGAAEKAGLHAGDKIIKVNEVNVISSRHTDVVDLIRSSSSVVLTVQQKQKVMGSPGYNRSPITPSSTRITGPQPVDHEKQHQLQLEKEQHYRLMIEKEQRYIDLLRSQLAASPDEKKYAELMKTEKNLQTLQIMLHRNQIEQSSPCPFHSLPPLQQGDSQATLKSCDCPLNSSDSVPPPLPKRNVPPLPRMHSHLINKTGNNNSNAMFLSNEINANIQQEQVIAQNDGGGGSGGGGGGGGLKKLRRKFRRQESNDLIDNPLYSDIPPPLPPRVPLNETDPVNSINKQMSYPLVATCATLVNDYSPTHQRTKSSPESLSLALSTMQSSNDTPNTKLNASESMSDLTHEWETTKTPPGTPPPPYPSPSMNRRRPYNENGDHLFDESMGDCSSPDGSPFRGAGNRILANNSPIHAANSQIAQKQIISMEDDEISDQEMMEDHGFFKSLSRLWEHPPHLAVFMNYILSNSDASSLLFYLLTDLYKEGNAKDMRKWAFEIHSCFLVPGAPFRISNVDENIAREIDDVLTWEFDKEEILRKIFWKARIRAKEELTKQLEEFQQKRTAGLGTIFGPTDSTLSEIYNDKAKEGKLYESLFLEKLDCEKQYLDDVESENCNPKRYYYAAALTTVLTRLFNVRPNSSHTFDRCPTFVSKEKSFRTKLIGKYSRKLNTKGHQFVAQQYYTVIICNNCHKIIYGIGPQGYQCSVCLINLHRWCTKLYEDTCPGPINKKDRGIGKFIRIRSESNEHRKKHSTNFIQMERERRQAEEKDNSVNHSESGENKPSQPVSRSGSDRRPDVVREEILKNPETSTSLDYGGHDKKLDANEASSTLDHTTPLSSAVNKKRASSNINRSESVKEQAEKRKQQRRNKSDPSHHNTASGDVELEQPGLSHADSGGSSSSSISNDASESPCNSTDILQDGRGNDKKISSDWESDTDMEPGSWQKLFDVEDLSKLQPHEIKRQDIINELFHTESTHVRNLRVLHDIFYKTLFESQALKPDELALIFPNIKEMFNIHLQFNKEMKTRRHEDPLVGTLGDMLVNMFGGQSGQSFQKAAATFCERQQLALEFIKDKRVKGSKFDMILIECEKKRQCRRLPLQGILPTEMQRLSKYPLLLERIIGSMEEANGKDRKGGEEEELMKLRRAHDLSKEILNYVNEATKLALNKARLEDIQKRLDTTNFDRADNAISNEFRNLDLTRYKLIIEGKLNLRRPNKALLPVHILLLEEAVIILHKEGDRYLLKYYQSNHPNPLSPIIKMSSFLVRKNASSKNTLFLINTISSNIQMYDLAAEDDTKRDTWVKHFSDAAEAFNKREGKIKEPPPNSSDSDESETVQEIPSTITERANEAVEDDTPIQTPNDNNNTTNNVNNVNSNNNIGEEDDEEEEHEFRDAQEAIDANKENGQSSEGGGGVHTKITPDEWPLIQPSQVHVEVPPVHTAESRFTSLEQIRRKDEEVRQAIEAKEGLVADLLSIPREHFQHIADMASQDAANPDSDLIGRVMATLYQVDQLRLTINRAYDVGEMAPILANGGKTAACQSQENVAGAQVAPSIPAHVVNDFASILSTQLTTILSDVKHAEDEREMLRKELHRTRELLHDQHRVHENLDGDATVPALENTLVLDSNKERSTESES